MHIDWWTLALQTVNVLVLLWLLKRFLMQPVAAMIDARQAAAAKLMADAEAARNDAVAEKQKAAEEAGRIAATRDDALKAAIAEAEKAKTALLGDARTEAEKLRATAEADIERHRRETEASYAEDAKSLAVDIAGKLVARLPDTTRIAGFVDGIASALRALPPESRAAITEVEPVPVRTARALTGEEGGAIRAMLADILGKPVEITVLPDPRLIAGLEIDTPHAVVRNSFRADLDRVLRELKNHGRD